MRSILVAVICATWFFANTVYASSIIETNVGVVELSGVSNPERAAFAQAIVKMTGLSESVENAEIRQSLRQSSSFLSSYEYFTRDDTSFYRGEFDRQKLQQLLKRAGLPIWGARRPDAILWIAEQPEQSIDIVSDVNAIDRAKYVRALSSNRGVNVMLPLMDLDDTINVGPIDVWGRFMPALMTASERYSIDYIIAGRVKSTEWLKQRMNIATKIESEKDTIEIAPFYDRSAYSYSITDIDVFFEQYEQKNEAVFNSFESDEFASLSENIDNYDYVLDWTIHGDNYIESGQFYANSQSDLYARLINYYADTLGARYSIAPSETGGGLVSLSIANIQSLSSMVSLTRYLTDLTVVQSVQLVSMQGTVGVFTVDLIGTLYDLESTLELDEKLLPVDTITLQTSGDSLSHFFWEP